MTKILELEDDVGDQAVVKGAGGVLDNAPSAFPEKRVNLVFALISTIFFWSSAMFITSAMSGRGGFVISMALLNMGTRFVQYKFLGMLSLISFERRR